MRSKVRLIAYLLCIAVLTGGCGNGEPVFPPERGDNHSVVPGLDFLNETDKPAEYVDGEVLVVLNEPCDPGLMLGVASGFGLSLKKEIKLMWATVYQMSIDTEEPVESIVSRLRSDSRIRYAEPNYKLTPCSVPYYPNDPLFEFDGDPDDDPWNNKLDQWGPNVLGASLCWPENKGAPDVVIAVLDTGYRWSHEDLANQMWINEDEIPDNGIDDDDNGYIDDWRGWDFAEDDNDPMDEPGVDSWGHGTACSGVVAAEQDNGAGCTGIAPDCRVMALRFSFIVIGLVEAMQYAYDNGASVLSMSFGSTYESDIWHQTIISIYDDGNGILPVAAAGNFSTDEPWWPAVWPEVVSVGATCSFYKNGERRDAKRITPDDYGWGSNYGDNLEVMAPGALYITTSANGNACYWDGINQGTFGGTSCATPCTAACFGLLKTAFPNMSAVELRQRLAETCDDLYEPGHDPDSGWGRVNVWRAIYGSDPNAIDYDVNGHIPMPCDGYQYDGIFDVPGSADYDAEDVFVVEASIDGILIVDLDIITTGEDLDLAIYENANLTALLDESKGPNGETRPIDTIALPASQGQKFYIRVYSPEPYNCTNFELRCRIEPHEWWVEWESLTPVFIPGGGVKGALLKLEFNTNYILTLEEMHLYVTGTIPLEKTGHLWLYLDSNDSGVWEPAADVILGEAFPSEGNVNQIIISGFDAACKINEPMRIFVVAKTDVNYSGTNFTGGVGLKSYKDLVFTEDASLRTDPFPILSRLTVIGEDHEPPVWADTIGVQFVEPNYERVYLYWNNAVDELSNPVHYNVYWDDDFPPQIDPEKTIEHVDSWFGGDYDHACKVPNLTVGETYYFLVRAEDTSGNEENNTVWRDGGPQAGADPISIEMVGELGLPQNLQDIDAYNGMVFIADPGYGVRIIDCTIPESPSLLTSIPTSVCQAVYYGEDQGYLYVATGTGLRIIDPDAPGGAVLVGGYDLPGATAVFTDGNICYVGTVDGMLFLLDIADPSNVICLADMVLSYNDMSICDISVSNGYVYCAMGYLAIVDASDPWNPVKVKTVTSGHQYAFIVIVDLWGDYAVLGISGKAQVAVVDISEPESAFIAGKVTNGFGFFPGVAIYNDEYMYAGGDYEIFSFDWDDPADIKQVGSCDANSARRMVIDGDYLYAMFYSALRIYR